MPLGSFLFGSPGKNERISNLDPSQQNLLQNVNQTALQSLKGLSSNGFNFQPIEEQARRNFTGTTVPSIANRFASSGTTNGSGYRNALLGAGTELESQLAALRSQYGLQNQGQMISLLQSLLGHGLTPHEDTISQEADPGLLQSLLSGFGNVGGFGLGYGFGNTGSGIASLLSNFFRG